MPCAQEGKTHSRSTSGSAALVLSKPTLPAPPKAASASLGLTGLVLGRNKPWCAEDLGTAIMSAWAAMTEGRLLFTTLGLAVSAAACSLLQNECDAEFGISFFLNLRWLVKTLKQWIDARWKLFSSCLRSQSKIIGRYSKNVPLRLKNVQSFSISQHALKMLHIKHFLFLLQNIKIMNWEKEKKKKAEQSRGSIFLWSHSDHSCIFILGQVFEWMAHFLMLAQHRQLLRDPFTPQQPLLLYWAAKNTKPGHSGNSSLSPHSLLELYFKLLNNYQHHLLYTESPSSTALYSALLLVEIGPRAHMSEKSHKSIPPDVFIPSAGLHLSGVALHMNELGWEPSGDEASEMKRFNAHIRQVSSCHIGSFLFKHCILFCEGNLYKE